MVKRTQHIGTFLHNEMGISMVGISPMCGRSSIHRQKIFFLKSIARIIHQPRKTDWGRCVVAQDDSQNSRITRAS